MNSNLTRVGILFGCFGTMTAFTLCVTAGCGSKGSSASAPDGGKDATADSSADVAADSTSADTAAEAETEAQADVDAAPISDGGSGFADVGDVAVDVPALAQFPHAVDEAYCTRLQQCCLVAPDQWNESANSNGCVPLFDSLGGVVGIADYNAALDSGLVAYDAAAAQNCLETTLSFACGVGPSSAIDLVRSRCFAAMQGTLTAGNGPCINSLECAAGLYCQLTADAGPGTCVPLKTQGEPCQDTTHSTDCTYLGNGTPAIYCAPVDGGTPTCQPELPVDAGCNENVQCQTWACNYPVCVSTYVFSDPGQPNGTCAYFTLLDAGTD